MGQCSSDDASAGATLASEAILSAGEKLPAIGEIAKLLLDVAKVYGKLADTQKEAGDVAAWATRVNDEYEALRASLASSSNTQINQSIALQLEQVERTVNVLLVEAAKIADDSKAKQFLKAALFQSQFETARNAVERTRVELGRTLAIDTNVTVHRVEEKVDAVKDDTQQIKEQQQQITEQLAALIPLIAAKDASADEKATLRALVDTVQVAPAQNQELLVDAAEKIVAGDGIGATEVLAAAREDVRESPEVLFAEGVALAEQGKWSEAVVAYRKCVERDPENSNAWFALGVGLKACKEYTEAEDAYRRTIEIDPKYTSAHVNLGNLLRDRGAYEDAAEELKTAIALDRANVQRCAKAHGGLASLEALRRNFNAAELLYRMSIALDPTNPNTYWDLSQVLQKKGDVAGAIELMELFVRGGGIPGVDGEGRLNYLRGLYIQGERS